MKNIFSLLLVLMISIFCSACVNNYAVEQLNKSAKEYMEQGDYKSGISNLEAAVELDANIYETRYNLAVAYLDTKQCKKALEQINFAQNLKKNELSLYYLQGIANGCIAEEILNNNKTSDEDSEINSQEEAQEYVAYLKDANLAFEQYLKNNSDDEKANEISETVSHNNDIIDMYSSKYGF